MDREIYVRRLYGLKALKYNQITTFATICLLKFVFSFNIEHHSNGPHTKLVINSVQVHDEEVYTCGLTYLDPLESCESSGSYKIKLNVLGVYSVFDRNDCQCKMHHSTFLTIGGCHTLCSSLFSPTVAPKIMQLLDEQGQPIRNGSEIGPLIEKQRFVSYCEARGARPKPKVGWYRYGKPLAGKFFIFYPSTYKKRIEEKKLVCGKENKKRKA